MCAEISLHAPGARQLVALASSPETVTSVRCLWSTLMAVCVIGLLLPHSSRACVRAATSFDSDGDGSGSARAGGQPASVRADVPPSTLVDVMSDFGGGSLVTSLTSGGLDRSSTAYRVSDGKAPYPLLVDNGGQREMSLDLLSSAGNAIPRFGDAAYLRRWIDQRGAFDFQLFRVSARIPNRSAAPGVQANRGLDDDDTEAGMFEISLWLLVVAGVVAAAVAVASIVKLRLERAALAVRQSEIDDAPARSLPATLALK